jgi:hypothetical protein
MSLIFTRKTFVECPGCAAKGGSPVLCAECLERRELWYLVESLRNMVFVNPTIHKMVEFCKYCSSTPALDCPEHGR